MCEYRRTAPSVLMLIKYLRLCALMMYLLWWNKPLLAKEPVIIRGDWVKSICAYMFVSSELSGRADLIIIKEETFVKRLVASLRLYSKDPEIEELCYRVALDHGDQNVDLSVTDEDADDRNQPQFTRRDSKCIPLVRELRSEKTGDRAFFERRPRVQPRTPKEVAPISSVTRQRWLLAGSALDQYPRLRERVLQNSSPPSVSDCLHIKPEEYLVRRARNWPSDDLLRDVRGLTVGIVLWMSNFVYGGIHAAAWFDHFPSDVEKWMWRSSAVYISFCGGLWILLNYVATAYKPLNEFWEKWMRGEKALIWNILLGALVFICGLSFCLARIFIVVEAFVGLRELSARAYDTPSWSQVLPHL
jgi:hypothetical protein